MQAHSNKAGSKSFGSPISDTARNRCYADIPTKPSTIETELGLPNPRPVVDVDALLDGLKQIANTARLNSCPTGDCVHDQYAVIAESAIAKAKGGR